MCDRLYRTPLPMRRENNIQDPRRRQHAQDLPEDEGDRRLILLRLAAGWVRCPYCNQWIDQRERPMHFSNAQPTPGLTQ